MVSLLSSVMTVVRLTISCTSSVAYWLHDPFACLDLIKSFISDDTVHIKSKKRDYSGTDRSTLLVS